MKTYTKPTMEMVEFEVNDVILTGDGNDVVSTGNDQGSDED